VQKDNPFEVTESERKDIKRSQKHTFGNYIMPGYKKVISLL
jgi:hypothetical protein